MGKVSDITGVITLSDGSKSTFYIGKDGLWFQGDASMERLGQSVDVVDAMVAGLTEEDLLVSDGDYEESVCPACGSTMSYCQGHGDLGDPAGHAILRAHDDGDHTGCHPNAKDECDE